MILSLEQHLKRALKLLEKKKLEVISVSEVGDRITIVLQPHRESKITVVDNTHLPPVDLDATISSEPSPAKEEEKKQATATCQFCGGTYSSRGLTRHENNCNQNPANQPSTRRKRRRRKTTT